MSSSTATTEIDEFLSGNKQNNSLKLSTAGKLLIGVTGAVGVAITIVSIPFVSPALRKHCLPYVPATNVQIRNILKALNNRRGKLVDLGSGDGRIVLETAKHNFESHGVELNPWLVAYSRISTFHKGLSSKTKFFRTDLWKFSLTPYDNVVIFGVEQMMNDLEKKILVECKDDCNIIACRFPLPTLQPQSIIGHGIDTVWVYNISKINR
ncbi:hypothetical protein ILUMI_23340 [Ignelater luminosus]|uniref:ATP synthase subunit C lysine N-methyltransferase n=1 Tax=Ignelater luminosus TaxID=2038154 RepID=A0A8K0CE26_IGNLU|nr:hypothetical protein ILUMI_23340 [Ignelater luminosus]